MLLLDTFHLSELTTLPNLHWSDADSDGVGGDNSSSSSILSNIWNIFGFGSDETTDSPSTIAPILLGSTLTTFPSWILANITGYVTTEIALPEISESTTSQPSSTTTVTNTLNSDLDTSKTELGTSPTPFPSPAPLPDVQRSKLVCRFHCSMHF